MEENKIRSSESSNPEYATTDLREYLTEVAEAIRVKTGKEDLIPAQDFVEEILEIETGSDTSTEDGLVTRTVSTYTNDRVTLIGEYAFYRCSSLTSVSFPEVTTIGNQAFAHCSELTSVSFPKATTLDYQAFARCSKLTSVSFPVATTISNNAFELCSKLTSVSFPVATTISSMAFAYCSKLTSVNFPEVTTIGKSAFDHCSKLTSVSFPKAKTIGSYAFYRCSELVSVYLAGQYVCSLAASNAFSNAGIWKGAIFVPSSLVASYKAATNWTFFSHRIFSIPE